MVGFENYKGFGIRKTVLGSQKTGFEIGKNGFCVREKPVLDSNKKKPAVKK